MSITETEADVHRRDVNFYIDLLNHAISVANRSFERIQELDSRMNDRDMRIESLERRLDEAEDARDQRDMEVSLATARLEATNLTLRDVQSDRDRFEQERNFALARVAELEAKQRGDSACGKEFVAVLISQTTGTPACVYGGFGDVFSAQEFTKNWPYLTWHVCDALPTDSAIRPFPKDHS